MKTQTFSGDLQIQDFGFKDIKDNLLKATKMNEHERHPVLRVKYKITFYWK